jgi:hypothetical protein
MITMASAPHDKKPVFHDYGDKSSTVNHMRSIHGMDLPWDLETHVKADAIKQWHADAHRLGDPGANNHEHHRPLKDTRWAQDPANPDHAVGGGFWQRPPMGNDEQMYRTIDKVRSVSS